jgi:hypothetical protein
MEVSYHYHSFHITERETQEEESAILVIKEYGGSICTDGKGHVDVQVGVVKGDYHKIIRSIFDYKEPIDISTDKKILELYNLLLQEEN